MTIARTFIAWRDRHRDYINDLQREQLALMAWEAATAAAELARFEEGQRVGKALQFADDCREMKAARYLFEKIRTNNPGVREPNWQTWARWFDLLFRVDKREMKEVKTVIDWCQRDEFWLRNILSPEKLRKQYDKLTLSMTQPGRAVAGGRVVSMAKLQEE